MNAANFHSKKLLIRLLTCFLVLFTSIYGCAIQDMSSKEKGSLAGAGLGALAGQLIGGNTAGTLIGAAAGAGVGYIIGNEQDKKKAKEMTSKTASQNYDHSEDTWPLADTRWKLVQINPRDRIPPYISKVIEFRPNGHVVTTTTDPAGKVTVSDEIYRVVGDTLIVNKPGYLINARFHIDGDIMMVSAADFSAKLQRISH